MCIVVFSVQFDGEKISYGMMMDICPSHTLKHLR